jgi:hypothetical protein
MKTKIETTMPKKIKKDRVFGSNLSSTTCFAISELF